MLVDAAALVPLQPKPVGFSFTPSGLCFPYGLGAASMLAEEGVLTNDVPLGGASGGGLVAAVMALQDSGSPTIDSSLQAAIRVNKYCRERGTARSNLREPLAVELDNLLGEDVRCAKRGALNFTDAFIAQVATRLNQRVGSVSIAITRFTPFPQGELISTFNDATDVKRALLATSCIPFYFAPSPFVFFRGWPAVDGYFAVPRAYFGAPDLPNASKTVRISPFEASRIGLLGDAITPGPGSEPNLKELFSCALGAPPVDDAFLYRLFERGREDALEWISQDQPERIHAELT